MDTRYAGHGGGGCGCGSYDISMVDRMMLKFRPIAPKPVASGSGSGGSTANNVGESSGGKRRYVRVKRKKSTSSEKVSGGGDAVVTLLLMPETPEVKDDWPLPMKKMPSPVRFCFKNNDRTARDDHVTLTSSERPQTVSFVTVGRVRETRVESRLMEWTEMERDTCPMFISDSGDRVVWTNKAYKDMAAGGEEVAVVLVRKEGSWPAAFTCNARVTCRMGMSCSTLTVPCDAWRMGGGGYAWGLDVKAALCLGR